MDTVITSSGAMRCRCVRLHRGEDLLLSIRQLAQQAGIRAGVVLSAVGCISRGRVRDASGVNLQDIPEHCEIVSLNGTVSASAVRGTPQHEAGAPAGGAVWITCDTYAIGASAKISADGLAAKAFNSYDLGGGAGGRIAIATGLSDVQKTALARTGTTTDISSPSLLTDLYPSVVSVKGGTGARNGQPGGDGTPSRTVSRLPSSSTRMTLSPFSGAARRFSPRSTLTVT